MEEIPRNDSNDGPGFFSMVITLLTAKKVVIPLQNISPGNNLMIINHDEFVELRKDIHELMKDVNELMKDVNDTRGKLIARLDNLGIVFNKDLKQLEKNIEAMLQELEKNNK